MTVAPEPVIAAALRGSRRTPLRRQWEHALVALGICLPVPVLAATGLSIPLPATVERLAAALVPWAQPETAGESKAAAASGAIVYAPGENRPEQTASPAVANPRPETAVRAPAHESGGAAGAREDNAGGSGGAGGGDAIGGGGGVAGDGGASGATGSGGSTSTTPTDGTSPSKPTAPVQNAVDDVTEATQPVVDEVQGTVTDVAGQTDETVDGVVDGLAGGLGK